MNGDVIKDVLPSDLRHIPENNKQLVNLDGACGLRSGAAHIFEDQNEGPKFRTVVNTHIVDRWSYYSNKIPFPYERQVGSK